MSRTRHMPRPRELTMLRTKFTELVGCTVPIQQAGMGDLSPPRLAAAVADAGALGMVGLTSAPLAYVVKSLDETRHLTSGIFGANFIYPGLVDETTGKVDPEFAGVVEAAASRARVVEFFYGTPDVSLVETAHAGGALVSWQVGSRDEAIAAERARCGLVVAQGAEAGGHVGGEGRLIGVLRSSLEAAERFQGDTVGERVRPWAPDVRVPVPRFSAIPLLTTTTGHIDAMSQFAGESVGGVKGAQPAGEIV